MTTNIPTAAMAHPMIAGLGFARMALVLALKRQYGYDDFIPRGLPTPRGEHSYESASAEYYRITDNAWSIWLDGHRPITRIVL